MNHVHENTSECGTKRVRWYNDETHETVGSYGYDTEQETKDAENHELEMLDRGDWVVLFAKASTKEDCNCPDCDGWHNTDTLCGIVVPNNDKAISQFAKDEGWI